LESALDFLWGTSTDDSGGGILYHVENCAGAGCINFAPLAITSATHYDAEGLTPDTLYRFRVRAEDASNNFSDYSMIVEETTLQTLGRRETVGGTSTGGFFQ
jgi:hypothetical protein